MKEVIASTLEESIVYNYWADRLINIESLELWIETDKKNGSGVREIEVPLELHQRICTIGKNEPINLFKILLAGYLVLLNKYSESKDILIAVPLMKLDNIQANDDQLMYIRVNISDGVTVKKLLDEIQKQIQDGYDHHDYFRSELTQKLSLRSQELSSIHQFGFSVDQFNYNFSETGTFPLCIEVKSHKDRPYLSISHDLQFYGTDFVERMSGHYFYVLDQLTTSSKLLLSDIKLVSAQEKKPLLSTSTTQLIKWEGSQVLHELFQNQVERTPESTALIYNNQSYSYLFLDQQSNQLAHLLQCQYQINRGDRVALLLGRSEQMLISLLAVLKVGAAYIPIDTDYPADRITYILKDIEPNIILTDREENLSDNQFILFNLSDIDRINLSENYEPVGCSGNDLAYIMYTSGSTGQPKGVMIPHKNVVNILRWFSEYFQIKRGDSLLSNTNYTFDISVLEHFLMWLTGGTLVLSTEEDKQDPNRLIELFEKTKPTYFQSTPSLLSILVKSGWMGDKELTLFSGGEPLPLDLSQQLLEKGRALFNLYGPTETTIWSSFYQVESDISRMLIGKPIGNTDILILDKYAQLQPLGVSGEICIGGDGVAAGYFNRPELNKEKFVLHPLDQKKKLYKTGDYGKYLPDGKLLFTGRKDSQIKVSGHRIELGEIENVFQKHKEVNAVHVMVRKDKYDTPMIVAYFISESDPHELSLRSFLSEALPSFMVPSFFIQVKHFPIDFNGKLDIKKLPDPFVVSKANYVAPTTREEQVVVTLWEKILEVKDIGVEDHFFQVGGNSIHATLMLAVLQKDHECEISFIDFFTNPTVTFVVQQMQNGKTGSSFEHIELIKNQQHYDLSYAQRRLWVLCQFEEDSVAYNMPMAFSFKGNLSIPFFKEAIATLAQRHESLRTIFVTDNGEPRQQVLPFIDIPFDYKNIKDKGENEKRNYLNELFNEEAHRPVNLEQGPLLKFVLVQVDEDEYKIIFNIHHIISDGWSNNIIYSELTSIYNSISNNLPPKLDELTVQYKDYTNWNKQCLESGKYKNAESYWVNKFHDKPNGINLPLDGSRQVIQTFNGGRVPFYIERENVELLKNLCNSNGATFFTGLLATVHLVVYKYSGQLDSIIGSPIAGRRHPDLKNLIGFLANTIVYRTKIDPESSFLSLLSNVNTDFLESFTHQEYPFDLLVEQLDLDRDLSQSPLFNVMVAHNNTELEKPEGLEGMEGSAISLDEDFSVAKFDLLFFLDEYGDYVYGELEYNSDLFNRSTAERIVANFNTMVNAVVHATRTPLHQLDFIAEKERESLEKFSSPLSRPVAFQPVQRYVENFAEQQPEAIALQFNLQKVSYGELNAQSNRLAHFLKRKYNIKKGDVVGVCIERSPDMIVAILAIIKTGAAYLGVDPAYPVHRVTYMLNDSKVNIVITDNDYENLFGDYSGVSLHLDADIKTELAASTSEALEPENEPNDIVYVIYTSGTTGMPNGARLTHGLLSNLIEWQLKYSNIENNATCLQFTSINFCVSFQEIFMTLSSGGNVVLIDEMKRKDIDYLKNIIEHESIENLYLPFSYLNFLLNENQQWDGYKLSLKNIITAGEQLKISTGLRSFLEKYPNVKLHNHYGSSEMHVVTSMTLDGQSLEDYTVPPAGTPIANTQIVILDQFRHVTPIGVFGDLYVRGAYDVPGYINNEKLNSEKLVSIDNHSGTFYKTGDVGRWLEDGTIELSGRKDSQLKIRGFRVELGEVEAQILAHAEVMETVVVVRQDAKKQDMLIAYVVLKGSTEKKLKHYLQDHLPYFMVPHISVIEHLPLMPNGKIDRAALPEVNLESSIEYKAPANETEKLLVEIWQDVLDSKTIGIKDNFFDLGGHSLKATQVITQIYKRINLKLELRNIFINSTVESLAQVIEQASGKVGSHASELEYTSIPQVAKAPFYPLSNGQARMWITQKMIPGNYSYNILQSYNYQGELDLSVLQKSLDLLVSQYEILRTRFSIVDDEPRQVIMSAELCQIHLKYHDASALEDPKSLLENIHDQALTFVFDLDRPPLINMDVVLLKNQSYVILLNFHHIIADEQSMDIFIQKVLEYYQGLLVDDGFKVDPVRIQYKDFSVWHQKLLAGESGKTMEAFWSDQFSDGVPVLDLPTDFPRKNTLDFAGNSISHSLSEEAMTIIRGMASDQGVSIFMIMKAMIDVLLYKYTGQTSLVIGSPTLGREHPDVEDQIGFFVNTLPLLTHLDEEKSFDKLLEHVKQNVLTCYEHQLYPFDLIVSFLKINRENSRNPLFDVMVSYYSQPDFNNETLNHTNTGFSETRNGTSKFDLSFDIVDTGSGLHIDVEYDTGLFLAQRIIRMIKHLESIALDVGRFPNKDLKSIDILSEEEKINLRGPSEQQYRIPYSEKTVVELLEEQAARSPEAVAVYYGSESITYKTLNERSNRLAHYLQDVHNVKTGAKIALLMQRSDEMIVAILGVLKSGAAYIPLEHDYPVDRIHYILTSGEPELLITNVEFSRPENIATKVLSFPHAELKKFPKSNVIAALSPSDLMYILYTSGSTGEPKGVMIEHRNVVSYLRTWHKELSAEKIDTVYFSTSYCFDPSVAQIFYPLTSGKSIRLLNDVVEALDMVIEDRNIHLDLVPSTILNLMKLKLDTQNVTSIVIGGDRFPEEIFHDLDCSRISVRNLYGPTEATIDCMVYKVRGDEQKVPIGVPHENMQAHVLNSALQLQPIGVPGEIYLSGHGLARGYIGDPGLTDVVFIPHPFIEGEMIYKTGDMGQVLPSGDIDFLGRIDYQVKIRGYRIECEEIEIALIDLGAKQAVVLSVDEKGSSFLVAYVTGFQQRKVTQIKNDLSEKLPGYMVPSTIICLDEFPLNSNGKVDRKQLPDPTNLMTEYIPPATEVQIKIAEIWKVILEVNTIGLEDNFFALGGHSLSAVRILNKVSREFKARIILSDLFNFPDLGAFCHIVEQSLQIDELDIPQAPAAPHYPLSNGQSRMWITQNMISGNYSYNMPQSYTYKGELNTKVLCKALELIVEEYEILRTSFNIIDGEPRQIIISPNDCPINFQYHDFRTSTNQGLEIQRMTQKASKFVFDLSKPPFVHINVIQVSEDEFIIILNLHHIISDEWSMEILTRKVSKYYKHLLEDESYKVRPLRIQYKDFVIWQKEKLKSIEGLQMKNFWLDQFRQEVPTLNLPADFTRKNTLNFAGDSISYSLSKDACELIRVLSEQHESSVFMTLLSTIYTLLFKYTDQSKIVIGTPSLGREHPDLEEQMGFFVNTLPLLTSLDKEESFTELLLRTKQHVLDCYENQFYPFDLIVSSLDINREVNRNPLFDVMVSYFKNSEDQRGETRQSEFDFSEEESGTSKFDLTFNIIESTSEIQLNLTYNTGLFGADRIIRMIKHLEAVVLQVGNNPSKKIKEVVILSEEENSKFKKQLEESANLAVCTDTLIGRFESQVEYNPQAIALYYKKQKFTYTILNEKANQLAGYFQKVHNIQAGAKIALLIERSDKMIATILAILKTGSAYIPIDPASPTERLNYILEDAQPELIIVDNSKAFNSEKLGIPCCNLSSIDFTDLDDSYLTVNVEPSDLAYIIYTSGSTGRPKGVMIEHRNVTSLLESWECELKHEKLVVGYFLTSYSFDPSVAEIFLPLTTGKAVRQLDQMTDLLEYASKDKGIMFGSVPSTISVLLELGLNTENVVAIKIGGDHLPTDLAHRLDYQKIAVFNAYGPTETTIESSVHRIHGGEDRIPIGKPLQNSQLFVLNSSGQSQPVGIPGEIYISGQGVGRGYLNNLELTRASFLDHPFLSNEKIYKTGDMGQWMESGDIDFLTRMDNQVKVRGFRIELRDVEIGLREVGLNESVVLAQEDSGGLGKILVAYVAGIHDIEITDIRESLLSKLPNYMIPSEWVVLDAIPLNRNGKIDRMKLRQLYEPNVNLKQEKPLTIEEKKVAELWKKVLQLENIGIQDNFFEHGGHSLKAIQLMSLLQSEYDANVTLDDVFQYPNIHSFMTRNKKSNSVNGWTTFHSSAVHSDEYYLLPPLLGLSTVYYSLAEKLKVTASVYGMNYSGDFLSRGQGDEMKSLVEKCADDILQLHKEGKNMSILGYSFGGIVAFEVVRLLELKGHHPELVMLDTTTPRPACNANVQEVNIQATIDKEFSRVEDSISELRREEFITRMTNISLISRSYIASGSVEARVTAFSTQSNEEEMSEWKKYTDAEFTLDLLSGDHWEVLHPMNLGLIMSKI